jgi:hypothetical protein
MHSFDLHAKKTEQDVTSIYARCEMDADEVGLDKLFGQAVDEAADAIFAQFGGWYEDATVAAADSGDLGKKPVRMADWQKRVCQPSAAAWNTVTWLVLQTVGCVGQAHYMQPTKNVDLCYPECYPLPDGYQAKELLLRSEHLTAVAFWGGGGHDKLAVADVLARWVVSKIAPGLGEDGGDLLLQLLSLRDDMPCSAGGQNAIIAGEIWGAAAPELWLFLGEAVLCFLQAVSEAGSAGIKKQSLVRGLCNWASPGDTIDERMLEKESNCFAPLEKPPGRVGDSEKHTLQYAKIPQDLVEDGMAGEAYVAVCVMLDRLMAVFTGRTWSKIIDAPGTGGGFFGAPAPFAKEIAKNADPIPRKCDEFLWRVKNLVEVLPAFWFPADVDGEGDGAEAAPAGVPPVVAEPVLVPAAVPGFELLPPEPLDLPILPPVLTKAPPDLALVPAKVALEFLDLARLPRFVQGTGDTPIQSDRWSASKEALEEAVAIFREKTLAIAAFANVCQNLTRTAEARQWEAQKAWDAITEPDQLAIAAEICSAEQSLQATEAAVIFRLLHSRREEEAVGDARKAVRGSEHATSTKGS